MNKTGFIYIWYDSWRKMYYVGCHVGSEDDGYVCSSNRMRDAHRRRPNDFKRRVIQRDIPRENLLEEEHRWLSMIPDEELGHKYYNLSKRHFGHWSNDKNTRESVRKKIVGNKHNLGRVFSEERKRNISIALTGKKRTEESKRKQSEFWLGKKRNPEQVAKIAASNTGKKRKIVVCPKCGKSGGINAMKIHHFDKCGIKREVTKETRLKQRLAKLGKTSNRKGKR